MIWHLSHRWGKPRKNLTRKLVRTGDTSFSNLSVISLTSQLILQPSRRFTYVTAHSSTLPLLHLRHSSFSNPSFASPTWRALHLRHLTSRPSISPTLVTKFSQNIVADTDKNKVLIDCHKCSSSFLSIVKSHPLKIPVSVLEKVRSGSCLKLPLIECSCSAYPIPVWTCAEDPCSSTS